MPTERRPGSGGASDPVFVLSLPRSGSTLLRFVVDGHSQIACPPESHLAELCGNLVSCWLGYRSQADVDRRRRLGLKQARAAARPIIQWHLAESQKSVFVDKSLPNVEFAALLADVFPKAKFVCLYRHPMDFIVSALEACRWGFSAYGLHSYASSNVENFVFALGRAWCERSSQMIAMERAMPKRCLRLRYEDLVRSPATIYSLLCSFLGVDEEVGGPEASLKRPHLYGAGDHKIRMTSEISTSSLGRGRAVPPGLLPPLGLQSMNELIRDLGYSEITPSWNREPSELRLGLLASDDQEQIEHVLTDALWPFANEG